MTKTFKKGEWVVKREQMKNSKFIYTLSNPDYSDKWKMPLSEKDTRDLIGLLHESTETN